MSYLKKVAIIFCGMAAISSCQASGSFEDLSANETEKLKQIYVKHGLKIISLQEDQGKVILTDKICDDIVRELPAVAKRIIQDNQQELAGLGNNLSAEDELEKKRLITEVQLLKAALERRPGTSN